jgi:hypothetical protein
LRGIARLRVFRRRRWVQAAGRWNFATAFGNFDRASARGVVIAAGRWRVATRHTWRAADRSWCAASGLGKLMDQAAGESWMNRQEHRQVGYQD